MLVTFCKMHFGWGCLGIWLPVAISLSGHLKLGVRPFSMSQTPHAFPLLRHVPAALGLLGRYCASSRDELAKQFMYFFSFSSSQSGRLKCWPSLELGGLFCV